MRRSVAFFAMPEEGHFRRLLPLVSGLSGRFDVHVFTDRRFRPAVERAGGAFVDLFDGRPLDEVDAESRPVPCRFVSFAGAHADAVREDVEALRPSLIVSDTFAVVGRVVARLLGVPHVNVCAGHNVDPARFLPRLAVDPRVSVSPACLRAVEVLRDRFGVTDASPFSYVSGLSEDLNVYGEPSAWLTEEERRVFEPVAFFGSLASVDGQRTRSEAASGGPRGPRVYVSFGTVIWRYYAKEALAALAAISEALARRPGARATVSLAGTPLDAAERRAIARGNVAVADRVDQWAALGEADVFVTHQGLNSTHEAIGRGVPMVSYPFFWDQPALAAKCRAFGLAVPLGGSPRAPISPEDVTAALDDVERRRESMRARLAEAREWEREVVEGRGEVLDRIAALAT